MKISVRSMHDAGLPYFTVSGGPLAKEQTMGIHLTHESGFTVGVSCDMSFCQWVVKMGRLMELSAKADLPYHIGELADKGYLDDLSEDERRELRDLLKTEVGDVA